MSAKTTLRIMPREMRMMAERILSLTELPKGFFTMLPDHVMYSQGLGLGGFAMLEAQFERLHHADPSALAIVEEDREIITLDAGGEHAWIVAASLLDLLGELVARHGKAAITVANVEAGGELEIVCALGRRSGLSVSLEPTGQPVLTASPRALTGDAATDDSLLWSLLTEGSEMPGDLWWRIYHMAKKALAPDTVVSRRHAGPMIVNEDGTVIGRKDNDDETDISFLASAGTSPTQAGDSQQ